MNEAPDRNTKDTQVGTDASIGRLQGWFQELRRRHMFKVTIAYLVLAWLLMQVAAVLETSLKLPDWIDTATFAFLLIGFPVALFVAWAVDLTPADKAPGTDVLNSSIPKIEPSDITNPKLNLTDAKEGKSSIAVLAFENMSGDPEQDFIGEGLAADIIAGLSRVSAFFVISRNSTFQYKGKSIDVRQVATELTVRYVLEGTVQKIGDRLRLAVQLIDGNSGHHLWAQKYDRKFDDLFNIQDELTRSIIAQLGPELGRAEYERVKTKKPEELGTWELFHRGQRLIVRRTKEDVEQGRKLLLQSLEIDPNFAPAHAAISFSMAQDALFRFAEHDPEIILEHARKAIQLDENDSFSWFSLGWVLYNTKQPEESIRAFQKAINLNPSYAHAYAGLSRTQVHSGKLEEGLKSSESAIQLSPSDGNMGMWIHMLSVCNLYQGNYEKAVSFAHDTIRNIDTWLPWMVITSALGHIGDSMGAKDALKETQKRKPNFSVDQVRREYFVYDEKCRENLLDGLRKAGLPEEAVSH